MENEGKKLADKSKRREAALRKQEEEKEEKAPVGGSHFSLAYLIILKIIRIGSSILRVCEIVFKTAQDHRFLNGFH